MKKKEDTTYKNQKHEIAESDRSVEEEYFVFFARQNLSKQNYKEKVKRIKRK